MTDAQKTPRRLLVRRVSLVIALAMMLLMSYAAGYVGFRWAFAHGHVPQAAWDNSRPVFAPLVWYATSELPGAQQYRTFMVWGTNGRMSWAEARRFADASRMIQTRAESDPPAKNLP